jgi:transposase
VKRKSFTSEFKSKVAIAALKGRQTNNEIPAEFDVHPTQVNTRRRQLLDSSADIFGKKQQKRSESFEFEREHLYSKIGQLKVEVDWLKKRQDISTKPARKAGTDRDQPSGYQYCEAMPAIGFASQQLLQLSVTVTRVHREPGFNAADR